MSEFQKWGHYQQPLKNDVFSEMLNFNFENVYDMVQKNPGLCLQTYRNETLLHMAICLDQRGFGDLSKLIELLKQHSDLNLPDRDGFIPKNYK